MTIVVVEFRKRSGRLYASRPRPGHENTPETRTTVRFLGCFHDAGVFKVMSVFMVLCRRIHALRFNGGLEAK